MMSAERCAEITLEAAYHRKREVLMGPGGLPVWLRLIAPGSVDRMAIKMVLEPIAQRITAGKVEA
jgi:hypothetical protein